MADSSSVEPKTKKKRSSNRTKKKKDEVGKETSLPEASSADVQDETKVDSPPHASVSPDPNCSICLGKLENKSFTDSCFHMFCFVCLLEWSKVKNECPLCKQSFKSIIHNVRSYEDYDQYHLALYARPHTPEHPYSRNFRYRTTLTEDRIFNLRNRVIGNPNTDPETVLQLQAIGAPRNYSVQYEMARQNWNRRRQASTADFRRRIYTNGMRLTAIRGANNRVRECSPEFFTRNPALTHRLVPWLNRELNALFYNEELSVQFCLELIMGLIKRFEISSEEFYQHLSPFMRRHTRQFMREFESFVKCPYCMVVYDKKVVYEHVAESVSSDTSTVNSVSDDDSDVQFISSEAAPPNNRSSEYINLPDISSEIQVTSTVHSPRGSNFLQHSGWQSPTPGPSWGFDAPAQSSRLKSFIPSLKRSVGVSDSEIDSSPDSLSSAGSDVQVVAYDKPWEERSPINLSSETEVEEKVVKEKTKEKKKKKKSKTNNADVLPSTSAEPLSLLFSQSSLQIDAASTSTTAHRRKKHKSRSWRDSHYRNRANTLFHRRSTSPEMSDSGRRIIPGTDRESELNHRRKRKHKRSRVSETFVSQSEDPLASILDLSSRSHIDGPSTSQGCSSEKRRRKEHRSPSVEIVSVHKKKKKHKKHKKHSSKHSRVKSSVVAPGNNEHPSQEDTDAYEDDSQSLIPALSMSSSVPTSESCGSTRSFTDVISGISETLNPVEIASNIAERNENPAGSDLKLGSNGVLDLTAVNLEEVDDEALKESLTSEIPSSTTNKSFKKHPTGHKKSRTTDSSLPDLASPMTASSMQQSVLPSFSSVMMRGDPLMGRSDSQLSQSDGLAFYSGFLQNFGHAFSDFNSSEFPRRPSIPLIASDPKYYSPWLRSTASLSSRATLPLFTTPSSSIVDLDIGSGALPLDLRQSQSVSSSFNSDNLRTGGVKSSTVTSAQTTSISSDDSVILSPALDVVTVDKETENSPRNSVIETVTSSQTRSISSDDSLILSPTLDVTSLDREADNTPCVIEDKNSSGVIHLSDDSNVEIVDSTAGNPDSSILEEESQQNESINVDSDVDICGVNPEAEVDSNQNLDNNCDKTGNSDLNIPSTSNKVNKVPLDDGHSSDSTIIQGDLDIDKWDVDPDVDIYDPSEIVSKNDGKKNMAASEEMQKSNLKDLEVKKEIFNNCGFSDSQPSESKMGESATKNVNLFTSEPSSKMLEDNCTSSVDLTSSVELLTSKTCDNSDRKNEKVCSTSSTVKSSSDSSTSKTSNASSSSQFWKRRLSTPLVNSEWRNEESSNETEDSESSTTDSYEYDSFK